MLQREKIFKVDTLWLQVVDFIHFIGKERPTYQRDLPFSGYTMRKGWSHCDVGPLLSHFSRHIPPRSGPPLRGHSSPRCCWTHVVETLQEERRLDHGRSWPVHWPGRCYLTRFVFQRLRFVGFFLVEYRCPRKPIEGFNIA